MRQLIFFLMMVIGAPGNLEAQKPGVLDQLPEVRFPDNKSEKYKAAGYKKLPVYLALNRHPKNIDIQNAYTILENGDEGDLDRAIDEMDNFMFKDTDATFGLGLAYAGQGNYPTAERFFIRSIGSNKLDADAWYALGFIYANSGFESESRNCWEAVMAINPEYPVEPY